MFQNYPEYAREIATAFKHAPRNTKIKYYRGFVAIAGIAALTVTGFNIAGVAKAETLKQEAINVLSSQSISAEAVTVSNEDIQYDPDSQGVDENTKTVIIEQLNDQIQSSEINKDNVKVVDENTTQVKIEMNSGATATVTLEKNNTGMLNVTKTDVVVDSQSQDNANSINEQADEKQAAETSDAVQTELEQNIAKLDISDICKALDIKQNENGSYAIDSEDAQKAAEKRIAALSANLMMIIPSDYSIQEVPEETKATSDTNENTAVSDEVKSDAAATASDDSATEANESEISATENKDATEVDGSQIEKTEIYQNELGDTITIKISSLGMNTSKKTGAELAEVLMNAWIEATDSIISASSQQYANTSSKYEKEIFYLNDCNLWGYKASTKSHDDTRNISHIRFGFIDTDNKISVTVTYRSDRQIKESTDTNKKTPSLTSDEFNKLFSQAPDKASMFGEVFQTKLVNIYQDIYKKDEGEGTSTAMTTKESAFQTAK